MVVMMRFYRAALAIAAMAAGVAVAAEQPRTYALVGAIGNRFEVVHEIQSTGTHLAPYDRAAYAIPGDLLNRLAVQGLDRAIARAEPESQYDRRQHIQTSARPGPQIHVLPPTAGHFRGSEAYYPVAPSRDSHFDHELLGSRSLRLARILRARDWRLWQKSVQRLAAVGLES